MDRPDIVRVWGHADEISIEFIRAHGNCWVCRVPPDTDDGVYAVEVWAVNEIGQTAYITAELFMSQGRPCLTFNKSKYNFIFGGPKVIFDLLDYNYIIRVRRCKHGVIT